MSKRSRPTSWDLKLSKRFERTIALVGDGRFNKLVSSHVLVVGLGGVGGAAAEALVRYGIGKFTFVDGDVFEESNLNRQILCTIDTIGRNKATVAAERARAINDSVKAYGMPFYYDKSTADSILFAKYDFCVDAIDDLDNKIDLITRCKKAGIPIITATGAGNRINADFKVKDINSTSYDFLARAVRKRLRDVGIKDVPAVCAEAPALNFSDVKPSGGFIPSCAAPPMVMGARIAEYVANSIIGS